MNGKGGIGEMNENGEFFADFHGQNILLIGGTLFHQKIHRTTWISPDNTVENQIDHIAVSQRWRRTLTDVRSYHGADARSDHNLVIAKLKRKIASIQKNPITTRTLDDISKLRPDKSRCEFFANLRKSFQAVADFEYGS